MRRDGADVLASTLARLTMVDTPDLFDGERAVLDQLRLVAVRVAVVDDLDDDLFARVAILNLERQHATDQGKERCGMLFGLLGEISDHSFLAPASSAAWMIASLSSPLTLLGMPGLRPGPGLPPPI
jgi:hypothetical protein